MSKELTPKEEAEKLVGKFDLPSGLMTTERKQCALIAVDEKIEMLQYIINERENEGDVNCNITMKLLDFNFEVKQEIEKL
jgi:hypothetical protein